MAKNYMQDVARMLGVELGEKFKIDSSDTICKFFENGLFLRCCGTWLRADSNLINLIKGDSKIVKLPWKPKEGDRYYFPVDGFTITSCAIWCDSTLEYALKEAGMIFKTKEECEAALPALRKKYLGGDDNV